jgi:IMP cyclohydrolase (EC 3.5.4.10)/phosphoribosylaminoimidazolecarboxamide formyltransferase (EC 2.1.2.3)
MSRPLAASSRSTGPLDGATAEAISGIFTEVVCAPDADADARAVFAKRRTSACYSPANCPIRRAAG